MGDSLSTCFPCFGLEGPEPDHYPRRNEERGQEAKEDLDTRRQRQAEAASRRRQEEDARGLTDPEGAKRRQKRKEEMEKKAAAAGGADGSLKWTVDN